MPYTNSEWPSNWVLCLYTFYSISILCFKLVSGLHKLNTVRILMELMKHKCSTNENTFEILQILRELLRL